MNIYVGNLNYDLQEDDLKQICSEFGEVVSVKIIKDKYTGWGKGFGVIELSNEEDAKKAINGMNEKEVQGSNLKVNEARPPRESNF